jgi:hypothetical protein
VASNTSALKRWSAGASGLKTAASRPALRQHARRRLGHAARAAEQHAAAQLTRPALELDRLREPDPLRHGARDGHPHQL